MIANSDATLATLGPDVAAATVVPSPVDVDAIVQRSVARMPSDDLLRIGIVGRIARWKGQHVFLEAFAAAFPHDGPRAVVVGAPLFGEEAVPADEFKGNPDEAVWLPNKKVAKAWMEYVKTGATSDKTRPPAPFNVRAFPKGDQGTELTWDAEADSESGIQQFIILRDGQVLAKVPEKPIGKFGRALFQSMTYHDTPSQPLPEMRYVDASAKAGETHTYSIITVNSVGLKSEPSAQTR